MQLKPLGSLFAIIMMGSMLPNLSFAQGASETILHTFIGEDGGVPVGVVLDKFGHVYGTTYIGGSGPCTFPGQGCGEVFEATPVRDSSGSIIWKPRVIYEFQGGSDDGAAPYAPPVPDGARNLYGTTAWGGVGCGNGCGTVFQLSWQNGKWVETVLHKFTGGSDGGTPESSVLLDKAGDIFGTTLNGGKTVCGGFPCGVVYELQPTASGWTETVLHSFEYSDGANPVGGLVMDGLGNLYGVTSQGGGRNSHYENGGTIFELSPNSSGWSFHVLYTFPSGGGGSYGGLTIDANGNLYGTANSGGIYGLGSVYELQPPAQQGDPWVFNTLLSFDYVHGSGPAAGVVFDAAGNLYGTAGGGGTAQTCDSFYPCGVVFELSPSNGEWIENVLYNFQGVTDGEYPNSTPVLDPWGNLYGTTKYGGDPNCIPFPDYSGCGIIYQIKRTAAEEQP